MLHAGYFRDSFCWLYTRKTKTGEIDGTTYKVFGKTKNFKKFITALRVTTIIIAIPSLPVDQLKDDPRITRRGKFLRRTSLDELPRIFNALKGEMSLVGPRDRHCWRK
jgi:lipopolysaccharide/colanic/teichoic acid biosynthesis glycosyltransferase